MPYFDPSVDAALLPTELQDHPELGRVAAEAEADVMARYTSVVGDATTDGGGVGVALTGYDPDPSKAEPGLRAAVKGALARVVAHRLLTAPAQNGVRYEQRGSRSVGYDTLSDGRWPRGWAATLLAFDGREPAYRI